MQVEFHLGDDVSSSVTYDPTKRLLIFTPILVRGSLIDVAGLKVVGKGGNTTQALLTVNKTTGVLALQGKRAAKAAVALPFDSDQPPRPPKQKKPKKEPATQ